MEPHRQPRWRPAALLFVVAAIATAAAAAAAPWKSSSPVVATEPGITVGPGSTPTATLPPAPQPTITTGTLPTAPGSTTPRRPISHGVAGWPAGQGGYTDVLASIAVSAWEGWWLPCSWCALACQQPSAPPPWGAARRARHLSPYSW